MRSPATTSRRRSVEPPLTAPATGTTPNGVFRYGAASGFPTGSFNAANYWVDPIFDTASGSTPQTITFAALANKAYGDAPVTVAATGGGSGNPVTFTVTSPAGVCTSGGVNGSTVTIVGAGTCTVQANQAGNATYAPAAPVSQSFTVAKAPLTVTADAKSKAAGSGESGVDGDVVGVCVGSDVGDVGCEWCGGVFDDGGGVECGGFVSDHVCGRDVGVGELLVRSFRCGDAHGDQGLR